jgi:hypothetical protein
MREPRPLELTPGKRYRVTAPNVVLELEIDLGQSAWTHRIWALPVGTVLVYEGERHPRGSDTLPARYFRPADPAFVDAAEADLRRDAYYRGCALARSGMLLPAVPTARGPWTNLEAVEEADGG